MTKYITVMWETFQQYTMTDNPHVNHVPVMTGGVDHEGVRQLYRNHLVGKFSQPDAVLITVSRTIGTDQLVDEVVFNEDGR
jgi:carboxymethylenebutenolidase